MTFLRSLYRFQKRCILPELHDIFLKVAPYFKGARYINQIERCFESCMIFCEVELISFRHAIVNRRLLLLTYTSMWHKIAINLLKHSAVSGCCDANHCCRIESGRSTSVLEGRQLCLNLYRYKFSNTVYTTPSEVRRHKHSPSYKIRKLN